MACFLLYVPLGHYPDSWLVHNPYIREAMDDFYAEMEPDGSFCLEPDGYLGLERSLLPFARSENGQYLTWDISKRGPDKKCLSEQPVKQVLGLGYPPLSPTFEPLALG